LQIEHWIKINKAATAELEFIFLQQYLSDL